MNEHDEHAACSPTAAPPRPSASSTPRTPDGFVSLMDLSLAPQPRLATVASSGTNLLAVGSGIDCSLELYEQLRYEYDAPIDGAPPRREGWLYKEGHSPFSPEGKLLGGLFGTTWRRRYAPLALTHHARRLHRHTLTPPLACSSTCWRARYPWSVRTVDLPPQLRRPRQWDARVL
jgi:hypothetical protein